MVTVQPGKVPTYTPSPNVQLEDYEDSDRTRFVFNGSQYVKASLVSSKPSFAYVGYNNSSSYVMFYTEYKDSSGKYALVNGEYYIPEATGLPSSSYSNVILVGFPTQISTSEITLWGISMLGFYENLTVSYSYDGDFFFDIAGSSVVFGYDADKQRRVDESPPTGLYYFTITLGATYTARYFRVQAYKKTLLTQTVPIGGAASLLVNSTAGFPTTCLSGGAVFVESVSGDNYYITYTGKTATSFTGVSYVTSPLYESTASVHGVIFKGDFAHFLTETVVVGSAEPTLEFWDTDGSKATTKVLDKIDYYDIAHDRGYDTYVSIRYNESLDGSGGVGFSPSDDFDYATAALNTTRWAVGTGEPNFQVNTSSGTLDYLVPNDEGRIITNYYLSGDFTSSIDIGFNNITSSLARLELRAVDDDTNNVFVQMGVRGSWLYGGAKDGVWEALQVRKTIDTTGGDAKIRNLRITTSGMSFSEKFTFVYDAVNEEWGVSSDVRGDLLSLLPGSDYLDGPLAMSIAHSDDPANGAQLVLDVNLQQNALPYSSWPWDWRISIDRASSSIICKYDSGSGFVNWVTYTDSDLLDLNLELYADGASQPIDAVFDNLVVTGTDLFSGIPVFSIETVNSNGVTTQVAGLSDMDGYVVKRFDVINDVLEYNSYIGNRVQIATDSLTAVQGGSLYIKIGKNIYKYSKSLLPLDLEDGSLATKYMENVVPETSAVAFSYSSYTNGALAYVEYDSEREGTYIKTVGTTTCSGTSYEALLDVASSDFPWAWDQNNYTTLYYVDASDNIKFYDMDARDVAFCNVVSSEKIMSAGTGSLSSINATVLNVYGEPLQSKTVTFSVSAGDGAVPSSTFCTNASGIASTIYTVGNTVGIVTITATASDVSC